MTEPDTLTVKATGLAYGGSTIGTIIGGKKEQIGKRAFVEGVVPGEEAEIYEINNERNLVKGKLLRILNASPARVEPPCPVFQVCGGCDYQHIEIQAQRELKREMVETTLKFQGRVVPSRGVKLIGESLPSYEYRQRVAFHLDESGNIGFFKRLSSSVVNTDRCLLARPAINDSLRRITPHLKNISRLIGGIIFEERGSSVHTIMKVREEKSPTLIESLGYLSKEVDNLTFSYRDRRILGESSPEDVGHFAQVNPEANKILIEAVRELVSGKTVCDLFSGSGNLSLPLASDGRYVYAVESVPELVEAGRSQAKHLGIEDRITFINSRCEIYVRKNLLPETVVLDPPRSGAKEVANIIDPRLTSSIIYVSCNLPSLSRDLGILQKRGYIIDNVSVLDMFPQTHHVETITLLRAT